MDAPGTTETRRATEAEAIRLQADEHPLIEAERAGFAEYAASFEGGH